MVLNVVFAHFETVFVFSRGLADRDRDGKLNLEEFVIASVLIFGRKQGVPIPTSLPAELTSTLAALNKQPPAGAVATPLTRVDSVKDKVKRTSSTTGTKDKKSSSGSKSKKSKWSVTPTEKKKYREIFQEKSSGGYISGQQAVSLFTKSKLTRDDLAKVWALADMDRDNQLSQQEFIVAMHLITKRVAGEEVPETVPASLVESASSAAATKERKLKTSASTAALDGPSSPVAVLQPSVSTSILLPEEPRPVMTPTSPVAAVPANILATNHTYTAISSSSLAQLGVPERVIDSYDPSADAHKISEISDLPALQQLLSRVTEEVRSLKLRLEQQTLTEGTLTERVAFKAQQSRLLEGRRQQSDRIFQDYSGDIQADEEDLQITQDDIKTVIADLERAQNEMRAPGVDINSLRQKRRDLTQQAAQLKAEFSANKEEYSRLASELEALRAADAAAAATSTTALPNAASFSDHGFNSEFDDKFDFTTTNSSAGGFEDSFDFSAVSVPRLNAESGTMTPTHEFGDDFAPAHEPDTDWLGQTGLHTPAEPNTDFFNGSSGPAAQSFGGDANWADFGVSGSGSGESPAPRRPRKSAAKRDGAKGELKKQSSRKKVTSSSSPSGSGSKDKKKK